MSTENSKNAGIEILGQKLHFPNTAIQLSGFVVFFTALVFLLCFIMINRYGITKTNDGISFTFLGENEPEITKGYSIGFWTPSDDTKTYLTNIDKSEMAKYEWQMKAKNWKDFEDANQEFGTRIKCDLGILGYRRTKVMGKGENSHFKEGWWWTVGFEGVCDEAFLKRLKDTYKNFWNPDGPEKWNNLYVEVIGNMKK